MADPREELPSVRTLRMHLETSGWNLTDADGRTELWLSARREDEVAVVLPSQESERVDPDQILRAVRAIAFVEQRTVQEFLNGLAFEGGSEVVAVRLSSEGAPSGSARIELARNAIDAVHSFLVGSAAALDSPGLVLPPRRPAKAESFASRALVSTAPGSFVINVTIPAGERDFVEDVRQEQLLDVQPVPYGRRVAARMRAVARDAVSLAEAVAEGERQLSAFAAENNRVTANATELAALASLGGLDRNLYQLRFAPSDSVLGISQSSLVRVTPGNQRILEEAAEYLRTREPRADITVVGLVVRLFRQGSLGSGEIVVDAVIDDTGRARRLRMDLSESDYNEAYRAHGEGLLVAATGDLTFAGSRTTLRNVRGFSVLPTFDA
jgi:hypothetical protein